MLKSSDKNSLIIKSMHIASGNIIIISIQQQYSHFIYKTALCQQSSSCLVSKYWTNIGNEQLELSCHYSPHWQGMRFAFSTFYYSNSNLLSCRVFVCLLHNSRWWTRKLLLTWWFLMIPDVTPHRFISTNISWKFKFVH